MERASARADGLAKDLSRVQEASQASAAATETMSQTFATETASLEAQLADEVKRSEAAAAAATEAEAALGRDLEVNLYCVL